MRGAGTQRRPLGLLALLAAAGDAGVPREQVLLSLWPDSDPPRARSSLNQLLYALRRDLGVTDLVLGNATLRLNRHLVGSDVADFRAAVAAGRGRRTSVPASTASTAAPQPRPPRWGPTDPRRPRTEQRPRQHPSPVRTNRLACRRDGCGGP